MKLTGESTWEAPSGFTLVELLVTVSVFGILTAVAFGAYRRYLDVTAADRAAAVLASDISRTRSYAVQRRGTISLVIDETARSYVIRGPGGPLLAEQDFGDDADLPLTELDLQMADSVVFNARGLLTTGPLQVDVARNGVERRVEVNALGRSRVTSP